ncbi:hypothetical protein Gotur_014646 [Gossypium turneri]
MQYKLTIGVPKIGKSNFDIFSRMPIKLLIA